MNHRAEKAFFEIFRAAGAKSGQTGGQAWQSRQKFLKLADRQRSHRAEERKNRQAMAWHTDGARVEWCDKCGCEGEVGTCYTDRPFLHCAVPTSRNISGRVLRKLNLDPVADAYSVYCGYGSSWDAFIFFLSKEEVFAGLMCDACLNRFLLSLGREVKTFCYFQPCHGCKKYDPSFKKPCDKQCDWKTFFLTRPEIEEAVSRQPVAA
jgi:hypothetical protein